MDKFSFKILLLSVIFVIAFGKSSCQDVGTIANKNIAQTNPDEVLLEVYTESKHMVYPPGKVLNIKLYSSGKAEYDFYPPQDAKEPFKLERREMLFDKEELETIKKLVGNPTLSTTKNEYSPTVPILDASITTTVIYRQNGKERKIVLNENHSNLILEKKEGIYPKVLLDLLLFVQNFNRNLFEDKKNEKSKKTVEKYSKICGVSL
jgi:hypothetical protein